MSTTTALLAGLLAAPGTTAPQETSPAQADLEAAQKIVRQFDKNNDKSLDRDEIKNWESSRLFKALDGDGSGSLEFDEIRSSGLFLTYDDSWPNRAAAEGEAAPVAAWEWYRTAFQEVPRVDLSVVEQQLSAWDAVTVLRADSRWDRVKGHTASNKVTVRALAIDAVQQREKAKVAASASKRLERLNNFAKTQLTWSPFEVFAAAEAVAAIDANSDGWIDLVEFVRSASDVVVGVGDFADWLESTEKVAIETPDLDDDDSISDAADRLDRSSATRSASAQQAARLRWSSMGLNLVDGTAPQSEVIDLLERDAKAADRATKSGIHYLKGVGLVLSGSSRYDTEDKAFRLDRSKTAWVLRVIRGLDQSGADAESALISATHSDGETDAILDAAVQIRRLPKLGDLNARTTGLQPTLGWEVDRTAPGDNQAYIHRYHLGLDRSRFLDGTTYMGETISGFVRFEDDFANQVERWSGTLRIDPRIDALNSTSGLWLPLDAEGDLDAFYQPRFAVEIAEVTDSPEGSDIDEGTFGLIALDLGVRFRSDTSLSSKVEWRLPIGGAADDQHFWSEVTLAHAFDEQGQFSFELTWQKGEDTPSFVRRDVLTAGIGVLL